MTIIGFIVCGVIENSNLKPGNPARLIYPIDYDGNICGFSAGYKSKDTGYYLPDFSGNDLSSAQHELLLMTFSGLCGVVSFYHCV